ncbi:MAG TPA: hypothetical protein PKM69_08620 [Bacteroidales bacterium]|nr:hypothetical protein [Bacteroidales bacterium]
MDLSKFLKDRRLIAWISFLAVIAVFYTVIWRLSPDSNPIRQLFHSFSEFYLAVSLKLSLAIIKLSGFISLFPDHVSDTGNAFRIFFNPELRYKKLLLAVLLLIWITNAAPRKKLFFSCVVLAVHFLAVTFYNMVGLSCNPFSDPELVFSVPDTLAVFLLFTCAIIWFRLHPVSIYKSLSGFNIDLSGLKTKITPLIVIIYIYIILNQFLFEYFTFSGWVSFLFVPAQKILSLFGFNSVVDSTYLIGDNGIIYMAKFCLGIKTMYLFSAIVYLTGRKNIKRWIYIIAGVAIINVINILRFVLLFIHVQKYGDYNLNIDLHLLYNLVLYSIVFLLWIYWFEKYSDILPEKKKSI